MIKLCLKTLLIIVLGLIMALTSMMIWSLLPVKNNTAIDDPAVIHLNALSDTKAYTSNYSNFDGNSLHYVEAGDGDTILFLHGFPSYWFSFSKQMDALRRDYRVIAIDGLGTGRSDVPRNVQDYTLDHMSDHIMSLMDELGIETFHIVGHDWGSSFAFGLAKAYPDRVRTVTGISAPPLNILLQNLETEPFVQAKFSYIEQFKRANPILLKALGHDKRVWTNTFQPLVTSDFLSPKEGEIFRNATKNPKRIDALINWYRANIPAPEEINAQSYWPHKNARISTPALFIWGESDPIFVPKFIDDTLKISDDLEIMVLKDVGHRPQIERPEEVSKAIRNLIQSQ